MRVCSRTMIRLWLTRGMRAARADEDEGPRIVELVERGLCGCRVARAFEDDACRRRSPAGPSGHVGSSSGMDDARRLRSARACRRRTSDGSLTVMSSMPRARSTATVSAPTGPAPVTRTRSSASAPDRFTRVDRDRGRLGERGVADGESVGDPQQPARVHASVAAEGAVPRREVGRRSFEAHRRPSASASPARPAAGARVRDDPRARFPHVVGARTLHDSSRPLVSEHVAGPWRSARGRDAGRFRRCRSWRPRRAPRPGPGTGTGSSWTSIRPSPT